MLPINTYPRWKYLLLLAILITGILYSLPNIYGEDPSVQVGREGGETLALDTETDVRKILEQHHIVPKAIEHQGIDLLIRFNHPDVQLKAKDILKASLPADTVVALNLAPATPQWLQAIGANPLKLGLDLRGGVHFLLEVDTEATVRRRMEGFLSDIRHQLREERLRYVDTHLDLRQVIFLSFESDSVENAAFIFLKKHFSELDIIKVTGEVKGLRVTLSELALQALRNDTIEQTIVTLRNRVNELGVAESIVQRQGLNRVVVELPGVQDTARAKDILGKTATLEFVMQDDEHDVREALGARVPPGTRLLKTTKGQPVLVKKRAILTGDSISGAVAGYDSRDARPTVSVRVSGAGLGIFKKVTRDNVGKQMAVVYIETKTNEHLVDGVMVKENKLVEKIISLATIQSGLGSQFQITGLTQAEAEDLALLLRAGALPAAISIVEERTVGPSLGQENIHLGVVSMEVGLACVLLFMACYYSVMGIIADLALVINLILLVAIQAMVGATLTLPGIAGIVLTMGMAVDANVLIFERIREEMRLGKSVQLSIHGGFERAFSTIMDSNITTLIAAVVLFSVGTGPVRGFAVTLSLGILTSMLTTVTGTRAMVNLMYGNKPNKTFRVGI